MILVRAPGPELTEVVDFCWSARAGSTDATAFHQFFPGSSADLVFRYSPEGCRMALLGPATSTATVEIHGASHYFGIRFRTGQAPLVADVHPSETIDERILLDSLFGERIDSLADRLLTLPDHPSRQRVLEELLRGRRPMLGDERTRRAAQILEERAGRIGVSQLASRMGMHVRSLERLFQLHLGLSPKFVARLARIKHLLQALRAGGYGSLADLALRCGYADQSHMANDFKALTGKFPKGIDHGFTGLLDGKPRSGVVHRYRP